MLEESFIEVFYQSLKILFIGDKEVWSIIAVSLKVSSTAIIITIPLSLITAFFIVNINNLFIKNIIVSIMHALISIPSVVIGLTGYILFSNGGLFGDLNWIFTQKAMIFGQVLLAYPLLSCVFYAAIKNIYNDIWENVITLGGNYLKFCFTIIFDCRYAMISGIILAFSRIISEVGAAMMLGGNILNYTRNITTAISLQTSQGDFIQGISLGIVLIIIALCFSFFIFIFNKKVL